MRMNLTLLAVSATLAFGVLMQEVNAAASVSLCNDGDVVVKAVIIDNRKHHMDGWYEINPHRCGGMTSGGSVDLTVGLFTRDWYAESGYVKYYDFDPPKIYKPGLMWIPDNEIRVDESNRWACITADIIDRSGSASELESCPKEWMRVPFVWHVWAYPNDDKYYDLHFKSSDNLIKKVKTK